jgi:hypothetical protein
MQRRFPLFALAAVATVAAALPFRGADAAGVQPLPAAVTAVVDTSGDLSIACVETEPGGVIRGGWWDSGNPGTVDLCDLLPAGTYVDPAACNSNDGLTIVGRGDGGTGGFSQVPVLCRSGASLQLTYIAGFDPGKAQQVSSNGTRIWGGLFAARWFPFLWRDDNTLVWNSNTDAWWLGNFFSITQLEILDCSDDGRYACGWYEWAGDGKRWPFVIDSQDATSSFEDCFGGNSRLHEGEARCISGDGSKVFVHRFDNDKTYETDCTDPVPNLAIIADGAPLFCDDDGSKVVGVELDGTSLIGWIWNQGSGQDDIEVTGNYDSFRPLCLDRTGKSVGGVLQDGNIQAGLWRQNKHDGFPALTACRDSLNKPFPNYDFDETVAISENGRTFYVEGDLGGSDRCFYCELDTAKRYVWKEKSRGGQPGVITQYAYYAYYYSILAASSGDNSYYDLGQAYGEAAYNLDAPCRKVKYDYWQGKDARKTYKNLRTQQYLYEYYCYVYNYYGQFGVAADYGPYAEAYASAAYQAILADL